MALAHGQHAADLADGHAALAHGDDALLARTGGIAGLERRQRSVGIQRMDVNAAREPSYPCDADAIVDQIAQLLVLLLRLRLGAADDRHDTGEDAGVFRAAAILVQPPLHVVAEIPAL